MDQKHFVDVSSFFLVESSGDSEEDYCDDSVVSIGFGTSVVLAEDDAESCCCGSVDVACVEDCIVDGVIQDYGEVEDGDREDDHDSGSSGDVNWTWQELGLQNHAFRESTQAEAKKKVKAGTDVDVGVLSEEEKNRLFWKTCLAL